jgi:hypothetical protein
MLEPARKVLDAAGRLSTSSASGLGRVNPSKMSRMRGEHEAKIVWATGGVLAVKPSGYLYQVVIGEHET